jgi:Ni/Fe-hydrogenase 1 B-type cytochrome subunit
MGHSDPKAYYLFSPFLRIFHWVMFIATLILFVTGLYIGNPFFLGSPGIEPTYAFQAVLSMETIRYVHFIAAWILVASFIFRVYGWIINRGDRLLPKFWTKLYWEGMKDVTLHYLFIASTHRPYLRNSLARSSYIGLYGMMFVVILTGFAMYYQIDPNSWGAKMFGWLIPLMGSEYTVHLIHHIVAWLIILFAIVHVYMAVRADAMEKEGEISSMFSGIKYVHPPLDIEDIDVWKK